MENKFTLCDYVHVIGYATLFDKCFVGTYCFEVGHLANFRELLEI